MINIAINLATLMGLGLIVLAITLLISTFTGRPIEGSRVIQSLVLAVLYFLAGGSLLLYGWRFDPIMQLSQVILVGVIGYLTLKDLNRD
ncbi:Ycf66 family protein [Leptolyngbya sp. NIES-2104]|uniref:Ycf66 family protein n=1 Tax=Leptolyngbya sp. NIES-2104 TaxID=1552121 RepID=UPI0006EC5F3C|nr:Ycf66 family protein [Leptolyngbya sp. NIES-2104]GAP97637.1 hypothetical protein NIES2104_41840 [Leptolyngbya sp. NIES-2104]